jgi:hypothetical protein
MAAAIDQAVRKLMSIEQIRRRITLRIYAGNNVQKVGEARPVKSTNWGAWLLKFILMVSADCEPHVSTAGNLHPPPAARWNGPGRAGTVRLGVGSLEQMRCVPFWP